MSFKNYVVNQTIEVMFQSISFKKKIFKEITKDDADMSICDLEDCMNVTYSPVDYSSCDWCNDQFCNNHIFGEHYEEFRVCEKCIIDGHTELLEILSLSDFKETDIGSKTITTLTSDDMIKFPYFANFEEDWEGGPVIDVERLISSHYCMIPIINKHFQHDFDIDCGEEEDSVVFIFNWENYDEE